MSQKHEYSTFGRQVGYVIIANVIAVILGLIRVPILTKGLGASLYGTYSLISTTVSLVVPFATIGFSMSIVRFLSAQKDAERVRDDFFSACSLVFLSGIVFSVILFFLSDYLAMLIFKDAGASSYIKIGSVLILIDSLSPVLLSFFRMRRKIGMHTIFNLSQQVLQVGLVVLAILLGYQLGGVITALIINGVIIIGVALFVIIRQTGIQIPTFSNMKSYLKWGIPLTPNQAIGWIIQLSDRYIVSYFLGTAAAGIYSASHSIGQYAAFAMVPLGTVLYPTISKTYDEGNYSETSKYLKYSLKYLMMISIPAAFGLSILSEPLQRILTTDEFVSGSNVIPWVAAGLVLNCFYQMCVYIIHLVGKTHITIRLLSAAAIVNVGLNFLLVPRIGIVGAAIAALVSYGMLCILGLVVTRRYLKFDLSLPFIGKSILASGMMTLCIWLIRPESIFMVVVSILAGVIIYFGFLLLLKGLSRQEITFFSEFIRDNINKVLILKRK